MRFVSTLKSPLFRLGIIKGVHLNELIRNRGLKILFGKEEK